MHTMRMRIWAVVVLLVSAAIAVAQATSDARSDNFVGIEASTHEQKEVMTAFETFARAVLARDFGKAHKGLALDVREQLSADALRARYGDLDAQYGELKKVTVQGVWMDKPSRNRFAAVVVKEERAWKTVQLTYAMRQDAEKWRVVWFKEGGKTPGGTFNGPGG